jgi:adenylylsulfate reductase, subunit B
VPTYVNPMKCDGCKALARPACVSTCPSDIMWLDMTQQKAYNREPDLCWECYSCVKVCPQTAINMRGYADVAPLGASLTPLRGTDSIMWTVKYRNGQMKRFKYPIRTTQWGTITAPMETPATADFKTQLLYGEPKYLHVDQLPAAPQLAGKES